MPRTKLLEHPLAPAVPWIAVLAAFALAPTSPELAPEGWTRRVVEIFGALVLATLAALHRPVRGAGGTLGIAALVLPVAIERWGAVPAALTAGAAFALAETWHNLAERRSGAVRRIGRGAVRTVLVAGAVLAAGAVQTSTAGVILPAVVYLVTLFLLASTADALRERRSPRPDELRPLAVALGVDAAGWGVGLLLADTAAAAGWTRAAALMAILALLAAEAARGAFRLAGVQARLDDLERLQQAHQRILAEISGMGGIAQQILVECANVLPVAWFQFELTADGESRSWSAGPDHVLMDGPPEPDPRPPALPGVHKRVDWRILEKNLEVDGETAAVVRLWCDPRRVEAEAEALLDTLVPHMASSVQRARLDREAKLDTLTGVPVRRMLESRLQHAWRDCLEEGWSMAVILCDIDHFKKINDTYGHAAGDAALVEFARILDNHRREKDLCCRYGGEEFALLLENTGGESALRLAERLRQTVAALEVEFESQLIPLTFSAGVAAFPELHIKTASELLVLADEALYEAKEQGRNRCLLNVGKGAYRAPAGRTIRSRDAPDDPAELSRLFG